MSDGREPYREPDSREVLRWTAPSHTRSGSASSERSGDDAEAESALPRPGVKENTKGKDQEWRAADGEAAQKYLPSLQIDRVALQCPELPESSDTENYKLACDGSAFTTKSDGTKLYRQPDGSGLMVETDGTIVDLNADGSMTILQPNGTAIHRRADGSGTVFERDGTICEVRGNGLMIVTRPDGAKIEVDLGSLWNRRKMP